MNLNHEPITPKSKTIRFLQSSISIAKLVENCSIIRKKKKRPFFTIYVVIHHFSDKSIEET